MNHAFLDKYSDLNTVIHKLDPRTKIITSLFFLIIVIITPPSEWIAFSCYFTIVFILILISRLPLFYVLKRSLVVIPFVVVIAIFIPFLKQGEIAGSFKVWNLNFSVTYSGLLILWNVFIKAIISVLSMILLSSTTKMPDLLKGLQQLGTPKVMVMIISFMYRYIFVLMDEIMRMKLARDSRNFGGKRLWQIKTVGHMIGALFVRSYERGERIFSAMQARGYDGESRTLTNLYFKKLDVYYAITFTIAITLIGTSMIFNLI